MAYSYQAILESQYQSIAEEQAQAAAELEAGRIAEDAYRTKAAADRILDLDKSREMLDRRARGFVQSQQAQPQGNKYGLNNDEVQVARTLSAGSTTMTNDDRERIYAENRAKYRHQRATGEYRDDQGRVTR